MTSVAGYQVNFENRGAGLYAAGDAGSNPPPGGNGDRQPPNDQPPIFELTEEEREAEEEAALQQLIARYEERVDSDELHPHDPNHLW